MGLTTMLMVLLPLVLCHLLLYPLWLLAPLFHHQLDPLPAIPHHRQVHHSTSIGWAEVLLGSSLTSVNSCHLHHLLWLQQQVMWGLIPLIWNQRSPRPLTLWVEMTQGVREDLHPEMSPLLLTIPILMTQTLLSLSPTEHHHIFTF